MVINYNAKYKMSKTMGYKPQMNLTDAEWQEIVSLDYVLTWGYTDDYEKDLKRYKELSKKIWGE